VTDLRLPARLLGVALLLVTAGADLNLADRSGRTPLARARARGYGAMARALERAGAR